MTRSVSGLAGLGMVVLCASSSAAFTQKAGKLVPPGHEWITRLAALEVIGDDPLVDRLRDDRDPRATWDPSWRATNIDVTDASEEVSRIKRRPIEDSRFEAGFKFVYDAIIGERWVDLGGFNVTKTSAAWNATVQEPAEVQYDHFMRRWDDHGPDGGVRAARASRDRFKEYFVRAATAPAGVMPVWDGGAFSELVVVDRNYFLFGRAVHLFQDSFSHEHTVRIEDDGYRLIRQVKSYLCAPGSEQHSHSHLEIANYGSGDVIWRPGSHFDLGWESYRARNMKTLALMATEATKDLWAAFIRTMATPVRYREAVAVGEACLLANRWLSFSEAEMLAWYEVEDHRGPTYVSAVPGGRGLTVEACLREIDASTTTQEARVRKLRDEQCRALYNMRAAVGYTDLFDDALGIPYNWEWRTSLAFETPPDDWSCALAPDPATVVRIRNELSGLYLGVADEDVHDGTDVVLRPDAGLRFVKVGDAAGSVFRHADSGLFLAYKPVDGALELTDRASDAVMSIEALGERVYRLRTERGYVERGVDVPRVARSERPIDAGSTWIFEWETN